MTPDDQHNDQNEHEQLEATRLAGDPPLTLDEATQLNPRRSRVSDTTSLRRAAPENNSSDNNDSDDSSDNSPDGKTQMRRRRSARRAAQTTVVSSSTRIAYDPGVQGVTASQYPIRVDPLPPPAQHVDLQAPVATAQRASNMRAVQTKLRRQLTIFACSAVAVTALAVLAVVALIQGL